MAKDGGLHDPLRQRLVAELRVLRRGQGAWAVRVAPLVWLVDAAGLGLVERAVARLEQLRQELGTDPLSDVGAFFWLGDVGVTEPEVSLEPVADQELVVDPIQLRYAIPLPAVGARASH